MVYESAFGVEKNVSYRSKHTWTERNIEKDAIGEIYESDVAFVKLVDKNNTIL